MKLFYLCNFAPQVSNVIAKVTVYKPLKVTTCSTLEPIFHTLVLSSVLQVITKYRDSMLKLIVMKFQT